MTSKRHLRRLVAKEMQNLKEESANAISIEIVEQPDNLQLLEDANVETSKSVAHCEIQSKDKLRNWGIKQFVARNCFDDLLEVLREEHPDLPKSSKALIKTTPYTTRTVSPGSYIHFGIKTQLLKFSNFLKEKDIILNINIYGLPLFKSSNASLWPILAKVLNCNLTTVFPIGVYLGNKKPNNIDTLLHDFVAEMITFKSIGCEINGQIHNVVIKNFICDTPARSFVCKTVGHNAFAGCNKCIQRGTRIEKTTAFTTSSADLRTDESFRLRQDPDHHKDNGIGISSLEKLGINMVTQFPLDPMHLLDLGVVRKILLLLLNGKAKNCKLTEEQKNSISVKLVTCIPYIPKEFVRKPRILTEKKTMESN